MVMFMMGDFVYVFVIVWVFIVVVSDGGKCMMEMLVDVLFKVLTKAARWGVRVAFASVVVS